MTLSRWFVLSICLSGCVRAGFTGPPADAHPADAHPDAHPADAQTDGRSDIRSDAVDAWPSPTLTCQPPALVGSGQPPGLHEPALRLDGATLVASTYKTYRAQRPSSTAPFGAWQPTTLKVDDGAFINHAGGEWLVRTIQTAKPRRLEVCGPLVGESVTACKLLSIIDTRTAHQVTFDIDGPSMVRTTKGLLMSVNSNSVGSTPAFPRGRGIWLVRPTQPSALNVWQGAPVFEVSAPAVVDDAALLLAQNGSIIIVYSHDPKDKSSDDLWFTVFTPGAAFTPGEKLAALNSANQDAAPELNATPNNGVEVFFYSNRSSTRQIYRGECLLQAP